MYATTLFPDLKANNYQIECKMLPVTPHLAYFILVHVLTPGTCLHATLSQPFLATLRAKFWLALVRDKKLVYIYSFTSYCISRFCLFWDSISGSFNSSPLSYERENIKHCSIIFTYNNVEFKKFKTNAFFANTL